MDSFRKVLPNEALKGALFRKRSQTRLRKGLFSESVPKRGSERDSFRKVLPNEALKGTLFGKCPQTRL